MSTYFQVDASLGVHDTLLHIMKGLPPPDPHHHHHHDDHHHHHYHHDLNHHLTSCTPASSGSDGTTAMDGNDNCKEKKDGQTAFATSLPPFIREVSNMRKKEKRG